jgi:hypothetical protein
MFLVKGLAEEKGVKFLLDSCPHRRESFFTYLIWSLWNQYLSYLVYGINALEQALEAGLPTGTHSAGASASAGTSI